MRVTNEATEAQIRAAIPNLSTWVSANAGSGKTRVLTNRVARLLLHGTDPQKILCLTYTKAAAAEMQNRLFESLGSWAMKPDVDLQEALIELGEEPIFLTREKLSEARTLFAAALETPGGLKIQTIHSFCDAMLRQFPLEAGLSPQFTLMDDATAEQLRFEIFEDMADGPDADVVAPLALHLTGLDASDLLREICDKRDSFSVEPTPTHFGITGNESAESRKNAILELDIKPFLIRICELFDTGASTNIEFASKLRAGLNEGTSDAIVQAMLDVFLTKELRTKPSVPKKAFAQDLDAQFPMMLETLREALEAYAQFSIAEAAFHKSHALFQFAKPFLGHYAKRKTLKGLVDYDDLISKARQLLNHSETAQWILFRLDGGIDHILVDEAQDTSPEQWDVIEKLTDEFFSGVSANEAERTIFVVGDDKQSIYSFQGADPAEFDIRKDFFAKRLGAIERPLASQELRYSFRSSTPILRLVDSVFDGTPVGEAARGIDHIAFNADMPGRVDLWPFIEKEELAAAPEWFRPVNQPAPNAPEILLAQQVAAWAADNIGKTPIPDKDSWRKMQAGDLLILVQSRSSLFHALITELKRLDLPLAGADRIKVTQELAVKDILSLLRFANLPEDDLSLAEALRSPLMGFSEQQLFSIAHGRKGRLWPEFRNIQDETPLARDLARDVLNKADFLRPYELIDLILTKHAGRKNLLARLGAEAEDAIDELLNQALNYEQTEPPTLTGFLEWLDTGNIEIKRQIESGANQIRVMTVHGAKGLEAPVVILPQTGDRKRNDRERILDLGDGLQGWKVAKGLAPAVQSEPQSIKAQKDDWERNRLLYVAMTRAERWLIVCGAGGRTNKNDPCWYNKIEIGLNKEGVVNSAVGQSLEYMWSPSDVKEVAQAVEIQLKMPEWMQEKAPQPLRDQRPISPSQLSGAKALAGDGLDEKSAMLRGTRIHLLLEHLPSSTTQTHVDFARSLLHGQGHMMDDDAIGELLSEVVPLLNRPDLAAVFAPDSLAEVGITAPSPTHEMRPIDGIIDRLIVTDRCVTAVDFKSNAVVPKTPTEIPTGVLAQMGAYLVALRAIYADRDIELAILWTRNGDYMSVPHDLVTAAFQSATVT